MKDQKIKGPKAGAAESAKNSGALFNDLGLLNDACWIEHMEDEMEPLCRVDEIREMQKLLKNSIEDRASLESLKRVRALVKKLDDVLLPESGHYYDKLHDNIMAKIMAAIDDDVQASMPQKRSRFAWSLALKSKAAFASAGAVMMAIIAVVVGLQQQSKTGGVVADTGAVVASHSQQVEEHFERKLAAVESHELQAAFARDMGGYESEEDFLTEAAASRLKQITKRQADAIIRSLM